MASTEVSASSSDFSLSLQKLVDSAAPSKFNYTNDPNALTSDSLPVIDFSALIADDHDRRSKALHDLAAACRDWGFFTLVNHGMPEMLMNAMLTALKQFLSLPDSEKKENSNLYPIKYGIRTITDGNNNSFTLWRDFIKFYLHPNSDWPQEPQFLREVGLEYTQRTRKLTLQLMEAVCDSIELDRSYADEVLKLDSSFQIFIGNCYPPCPHPDQAIGLPPHTDPGLLTLLIHNGVAGLQIEHDGQWYNVDTPQNSILVNVADQLQIFTNGRYKSVKHRAVVNEERERISIVVANGPSGVAIVGPAAPLVEKDGHALYCSMKYADYVNSQQQTKSRVKSLLEEQKIIQDN